VSPEETMHWHYCRESRMQIQYTMQRHYVWEAFLARGFTADDITLVCQALKGKRDALSFRTLISDLEFFEESLAAARKPSARKSSAIVPTPEPPPSPEQAMAFAKRLNEWKQNL
jgi:hypothetical protein